MMEITKKEIERAIEALKSAKQTIDRLEAENARLRARLTKQEQSWN